MDKVIRSFKTIRRGNYQLRLSVFGNDSFLIVGNHILDDTKFFVRHFTNEVEAVIYMEYIIEKDLYG